MPWRSDNAGFIAILVAIGLTLTGRVAKLMDVLISFLARRLGIKALDREPGKDGDPPCV